MPRRPKDRSNPDGFSIEGQPKGNKSGVMQRPAKEKKGPALETYEQPVEQPGPDSVEASTPDRDSPPPDRATPD